MNKLYWISIAGYSLGWILAMAALSVCVLAPPEVGYLPRVVAAAGLFVLGWGNRVLLSRAEKAQAMLQVPAGVCG